MPPHLPAVARVMLSLVGLTVAACAQSNAPAEQVLETFVAQTVNGAPLPAEVQASGNTRYMLEADTLQLLSGGRARRLETIRMVFVLTQTFERQQFERKYMTLTKADTIILAPVCGPTELCLPPTRLVRVGSGLEQTVTSEPLRVMRLVRR